MSRQSRASSKKKSRQKHVRPRAHRSRQKKPQRSSQTHITNRLILRDPAAACRIARDLVRVGKATPTRVNRSGGNPTSAYTYPEQKINCVSIFGPQHTRRQLIANGQNTQHSSKAERSEKKNAIEHSAVQGNRVLSGETHGQDREYRSVRQSCLWRRNL